MSITTPGGAGRLALMDGESSRQPRTPSVLRLRRAALTGGALLMVSATALSGEIYKSIDANGHVVYSDHADPSTTQTSVVQLEDSRYPPHELHICWTNCFTLILDHGVYRRIDGTDETWSVETFTAHSVALHRHSVPADWNGFQKDVTYAGQIANDRLIGATVNGQPTRGIDASWGNALNTLPGSNAERDAPGPDIEAAAAVTTAVAPPPLPDYPQPVIPQDGYLWTPGYWSWGGQGYAWVPGAWVQPPRMGVLWTPAYWRFVGAVYVFHAGYWGPRVGYYGGMNYGYGYFGTGYTGGHWVGNTFAYNGSVNRLDPAVVHHTYEEPAASRGPHNVVRPTGGPEAASVPPTPVIAKAATRKSAATTQPAAPPAPASTPAVEQRSASTSLKSPAASVPRSNRVTVTQASAPR